MGQAELSQVLSALAEAHANQRANAQQVSLDAFRQQQQKNNEDRIKLETKRAQDQHDYHQTILDNAKQTRNLQLQEQINRIKGISHLPQGSTPLNGADMQQGGQFQLPPAYNNASGQDSIVNVVPDEQLAQHQAAISTILNQPKVDEATRKEAQVAADRLAQQKAVQDEITARATEANENRKTMVQMHNDTLKSIKAMTSAPGAAGGVDNDAIAQDVADLLGGKTTKEDIAKKYTGKMAPLKVAVLNAAAKQGVPVGNADKQQLDAIKKHVENMDTLDNTLDAMPNTEGYLSSTLHALPLMANQPFNSNIKQLNSNLPAVAIAKSGTKRINNLDMKLVSGGYIPSYTTPKTEAIQNRDKTVAALNKMVEDIVPNASPAQKALFKQYVGLDQVQNTYNTRQALKDSQSKIDALLPPVQQQGAPVQ